MSSSVFLELMGGNVEGAVAISLLMILMAAVIMIIIRVFAGNRIRLAE